jgi:hypothetical protein
MRSSSSSATSRSCDVPLFQRSSSRCPRAIVTGVRSSCDASCKNRSCRASNAVCTAKSSSVSSIACWRRRACHTIARNIVPISGTSNSSPQSWIPANASAMIDAPVARATAVSTSAVAGGDQTRKP